MTVPVSQAATHWELPARVARPRGAARALCGACALLALCALSGCRQQASPGDPFLPFMKSRVAPPGTTVAPGGAPIDPYYNGTPGAAAPATVPVTPAGAPATPPGAVDKYSPRGGFNVPQGSIDRSKVIDPRGTEVKASATAVARRTLSAPTAGHSQVDTTLTTAKTAGSAAAADALPQDDPVIDSAMASFDDAGRPVAAQPAVPSTEPELVKPRASIGAFARPRDLPANQPLQSSPADGPSPDNQWPATESPSINSSTVRILAPGEDAFAADDEPDEDTVPAGVTRLRMTAGASPSDVQSKTIGTQPDRASVAATESAEAATSPADEPDEGPDKNVVQTVWSEPAGSPAVQASTPTSAALISASDPYSYEPSYASLRGRLEYSQSARQWKLRYIPIDGATDQFGGSVLLADSAKLEGFKPGDFVAAHGAIVSAAPTARGFSPRYELSQIEPVR